MRPDAGPARRTGPPGMVIFDCDGVLVDSEPATNAILHEDLAARGLDLTPDRVALLFTGGTMASVGETARRMGADIPDGWLHQIYGRMYTRLADGTPLIAGVEAVRPGNTFGDIGHAIQTFVEANKMSVVRDFCGHGLGRVFHAPPNVLHYGRPGTGPVLEEGMFFTIEPMVNLGRPETKVLADDWTAVTRDKSLSAQFEHSVGVTADGAELFTLSPAGRFHPTWG